MLKDYERKMLKEYHNIERMIALYLDAHKPTPNPLYSIDIDKSNETLSSLDEIDFHAFIYQLYTGNFTSTRFSNKSFLRYFMTSQIHNVPLDIANNLPYNREDFVKLLTQKGCPNDQAN